MQKQLILISAVAVLALITQAGCVQSQYVPNIFPLPTPTPVPSAPPMTANPAALVMSASASGTSTITVSQLGANQAPVMIVSSSTCIGNNNAFVVSQTASGSTATFQLAGRNTGQCIFVFGGVGGITLTVPTTVTQ